MSDEAVPLDKLAKVYRKIRDRIAVLTQEYDTQVEQLKAQQDEVKNAMKEHLKALGASSVNTPQGTVIMGTKTRYSTDDWDSFKEFVKTEDALDLFERRIHQGNMKLFLEDNPGKLPPGLNSMQEYDISVRKPSK
jgi:hypothetical protein